MFTPAQEMIFFHDILSFYLQSNKERFCVVAREVANLTMSIRITALHARIQHINQY